MTTQRGTMRTRPAQSVAVVYGAGLLAAVATSIALLATQPELHLGAAGVAPSLTIEVLDRLQFVAIGLLGSLIVFRRPDLRYGWLLIVVGAGFPLSDLVETWGRARLAADPPVDVLVAAWVSNWAWALTWPLAALVFLWFPDGRPPTRRWRPVGWAAIGSAAALLVLAPLSPGPLAAFPDITNPLGVAVLGPVVEPAFALIIPLQTLAVAGGVASLFVRFHRSRGVERQQLKWFLSAGFVFLVLIVLELDVSQSDSLDAMLDVGASALLSIGIGVALLRYRLWDIDRIISRTLAYALLVIVLASVYAAGVVGLGAGARAVTGESGDVVVALSTLAVAALFQPLRGRVQRLVDRRFNRARYDAARTVDAFGRGLRDEVSRDAIVGRLREVAGESVRPASVGVLLVLGAEQ